MAGQSQTTKEKLNERSDSIQRASKQSSGSQEEHWMGALTCWMMTSRHELHNGRRGRGVGEGARGQCWERKGGRGRGKWRSSAAFGLQRVEGSLVLGLEAHDEVLWGDLAAAVVIHLAHEDVAQA